MARVRVSEKPKPKLPWILLAAAVVFAGLGIQMMRAESMSTDDKQTATFAAGCFWGVEKFFGELPGVLSTRVGYTGGTVPVPTYEMVCTGKTGHAEALQVTYDPATISYEELLAFFFTHHDPTTLNRQGNDVGTQYRSAIFYHNAEQKAAATRAIALLQSSGVFKNPVETTIEPASEFYAAEEYHQKYLQKNPNGYCHINLQSKKVGEILRAAH